MPAIERILYRRFRWIARVHDRFDCLQVVDRLMGQLQRERGCTSVYESSVVAVGMAYKHFRGDGTVLSKEHLDYARTRGGVLGMCAIESGIVSLTLREYLENRDPEFFYFSNPELPRAPAA